MVFLFIAVSAYLFPIYSADASVMSSIKDMITGNDVEASSYNRWISSQNIPFLQAGLSINPSLTTGGGGDINIVGGNSILPDFGPAGTSIDMSDYNKTSKISLYVVRKGDTLSGIADMFDVSVNTIIWANDIKNKIKEGDQLVILPISGVEHIVKKGDTIKSIAKKYDADISDITDFNNIKEDAILVIGSEIIIPDGEIKNAVYDGSSKRIAGYGGAYYEGYYMRPVYGGRKTQGIHGYNAVDIGVPIGTPVMASASGSVVISRDYGWNTGYGQYIVIQHSNGTQTLYGHLSGNIVSSGQYVSKGEIIGYTGNSGNSTGPHIHFEIRGAMNPF